MAPEQSASARHHSSPSESVQCTRPVYVPVGHLPLIIGTSQWVTMGLDGQEEQKRAPWREQVIDLGPPFLILGRHETMVYGSFQSGEGGYPCFTNLKGKDKKVSRQLCGFGNSHGLVCDKGFALLGFWSRIASEKVNLKDTQITYFFFNFIIFSTLLRINGQI